MDRSTEPTLDKVLGYNIYVGGFVSLRRPKALAICNITHILSVIDWSFDDNEQLIAGFKHLHIPVDDVEDTNLITWFARSNAFIDDCLHPAAHRSEDPPGQEPDRSRNGILVHCAMGRSRSATLVLAYLLYDASRRRRNGTLPPEISDPRPDVHDPPPSAPPGSPSPALSSPEPLSPQSALRLLRLTRPLAQPNPSFMRQLDLYSSLGCPADPAATPGYQRWVFTQHVRWCVDRGVAPRVGRVRFEDQHFAGTKGEGQGEGEGEGRGEVRCKKCGTLLARGPWVVEHEHERGETETLAGRVKKTGMKECSHVWIYPLSWMKGTLIEGRLEGALSCPDRGCRAGVGEFARGGVKCAYGGWVRPGFGLKRKKIRVCWGDEEGDAKGKL